MPVYLKYASSPMLKTMPAMSTRFRTFGLSCLSMSLAHRNVTSVQTAMSSAYSACQFM